MPDTTDEDIIRITVDVERCGRSTRTKASSWAYVDAPPNVRRHIAPETFVEAVAELVVNGYTVTVEPKIEDISLLDWYGGQLPTGT